MPGNKLYDDFRIHDHLAAFSSDLDRHVTTKTFKRGTFIYQPAENMKYMFEVVEGAIKIGSYSDEGEEVTYDVLQKGDFFGNLKYLNGQFFEFSKTLVDTEVRLYELSFFKSVIINDLKVSEWFTFYLIKRWCSAEKKLVKMNSKSIYEKLNFLRQHFGQRVEDIHHKSYVLFNLLTKKDLGDLVGTTRQTVASALKKTEAADCLT